MDTKTLHRAFGILAFVLALVTYMLTVQSSVPFWDCGEFSSAAIQQQVPHPPGAPLFLMVGKVFHVLIPFGDEGWRINLVSVFSSAFCILLLYLISVSVINNFRGHKPKDFGDALMVFGSAFVGASAFTFSDTFWFNAVESEVYAASTLFVAVIVWLMMRWHEEADNPGHERYILLIAYLIGLSIGVHLLAVLTIFPIALVIYFRKANVNLMSFLLMGAASVAVFITVYPGIVKWLPGLMDGHWISKTAANEWLIEDSNLLRFLAYALMAAVTGVAIWAYRKGKPLVAVVGSCFVLMFVGYSTYTHILLRANAHPPMNENNPNDLSSLVSYLGREQYGDAPFWPRRYDTRGHIQYNFANYGEWYPPDRERVVRNDGVAISIPVFNDINTAGELNYLMDYQSSHMYWRYFAWNYIGRVSDIQDAPWTFSGYNTDEEYWLYNVGSYIEHFPVKFFALPLLFGLFGFFYHAYRDPRMAVVYFVLFLLTGIIAALQQNQQNPQPRERDYFYTGSFMVFAMWIGLGVYFLMDQIRAQREKGYVPLVAAVLLVSFVAVPANMAYQGWAIHDRSGNYLPFDYAYNILQSVEENAIIFTNGDNDTFPVWYLQDVAGVRRDVRIVNLSLGNTLWYVNQLKNERPWGAEKIPLTFSDESIQTTDENSSVALSYYIDRAREVEVRVKPEILRQYTSDPAVISGGKMSWTLIGDEFGGNAEQQEYVIRVQDQLVADILKTTKFERPVYYSMSVGPDAYAGLEDFFRLEGMCLRVCPVSQNNRSGFFACNEAVMDQTLLNIIQGDDYYTEQRYGWKLRNLNNPNVYYDESNRRPVPSYRNIYLNYATWMLNQGNKAKASAIMDTLDKYISTDMFPMPFATEMQVAEIYSRAGADQQAQHFAQLALNSSDRLLQPGNERLWNVERYTRSYNPAQIAADASTMLGNYDAAMQYWRDYGASINRADDPSLRGIIDQLRIEKFESQGKYSEAIAEAEGIIQEYRSSGQQYLNSLIPQIEFLILDMKNKAGFPVEDVVGEGEEPEAGAN